MAKEKYILLRTFCERSQIEDSFVHELYEYGLVRVKREQDSFFIEEDEISEIEKMFRLHNDLGINLEGLDVIKQMLERMRKLEMEMDLLQKKLKLYE